MGFLERYQLTQNESLRMQVQMAAIKTANAILADPARVNEYPFSQLVIKEPTSNYWLNQLMFSVVTNEAIVEGSPDNDVEYQVISVFPKHALAFNQTA